MNLLLKSALTLTSLATLALAAINLNTATKEELMSLDGIGSSKADAIIEYRKTNQFNSIEDLKNVNGIGDKTYENLKDDISVKGETTIQEKVKTAKDGLKEKSGENSKSMDGSKDKLDAKVKKTKEKMENVKENTTKKVKG